MSYPTITLEDHFLSNAIESRNIQQYKHFPSSIHDRLKDVSPSGVRLQEMDKGDVTLQVISHTPGAASATPSLVVKANDELHAACQASSGRYAGFAALPMGEPEAAVTELERCVKELGFVGALIDNHLEEGKGEKLFYDAERFWPVFAKAEELDVPVYIHPTFATEEMMEVLYQGNYGEGTAFGLSMAGWGWHMDTALHVLRLYAAGLFDRHPKLKIVIGHMGELIPYQLERIDGMTQVWGTSAKRRFKDVWDTNIYITTSGVWSVNAMACALRNTKISHILYSVDWPFIMNDKGSQFLRDLEDSGLLQAGDIEKIAYKNAEELLKVKVRATT